MKARIAAVAFGVFTLGIGTLICRRCLYDRKIINESNSLKFQKERVEKIFAGSNTILKIQEIKKFLGDVDFHDKDDFKDFEKKYNSLKGIKNLNDFIIKNVKSRRRPGGLLYFACMKKIVEIFNRDINIAINPVEINALFERFIFRIPFEYIFSRCEFERLADLLFHGSDEVKHEFMAYLSTLDFTQFREKYTHIKNMSERAGVHNPFLTSRETHNNGHKTMAWACEVLDALELPLDERDERLQNINRMIQPTYINDEYLLWGLLGSHCKVQDIPFLISYRFGFQHETLTMKEFFFKLVSTSDQNKWEASFPQIWNQLVQFHLMRPRSNGRSELDSVFATTLKSINTPERFRFALENTCNSTNPLKNEILFDYVNYANPLVPLVPIPQRMQIIKNTFWPECQEWLATKDPESWYAPPFNYRNVVPIELSWTEKTYAYLQKLLSRFKEQEGSPLQTHPYFEPDQDGFKTTLDYTESSDKIAFLLTCKENYQLSITLTLQARGEIVELIEKIKLFNEKSLHLENRKLVEDVEEFEALLNDDKACNKFPAGAWIRLKDVLEMIIFDAVMRNVPFQLFSKIQK